MSSDAIFSEIKGFFSIFFAFWNLDSILNMSEKKMTLRSHRFWKTWLEKCLKSPVSEGPSTSSMVNRPKHGWNLNDSSVTIFSDHCENTSVGKSLSQANAKSWDILLTHWLSTTSILFLIYTIYCNIFRCNYLRNKRLFLSVFWTFWKSRFTFEHFQKKVYPHRWLIFELTNSEKLG